MNIGIIDAVIILFILLGGVVGFKEGVIKKLTSVVGLILVVVLAFTLKNKLSVYFYENLPFFDLWGVFKGIQILNVIFYEVVAFLVIASVLIYYFKYSIKNIRLYRWPNWKLYLGIYSFIYLNITYY